MSKTETTRAKTEPEPRPASTSFCGKLRRSAAEAFRAVSYTLGVMLYRWVLYPNRTPNRETLAALREVRERKDLLRHASWEDFLREMDRA